MSDLEILRRPAPDECDEYYHGYVSQVPAGDVVEILKDQLVSVIDWMAGIPAEKHGYRYAPGKWTVAEVIGHLIDSERVFAYRALCFARGDTTPLPGMDQDDFVAGASFGSRAFASLIGESRHLRAANIELFSSFGDEVLDRRGNASGCDFTVRSLPYVIAGHTVHHARVLRERYL